ncbi:carbon-nitrogen hydrolase family protein [Spiribacter salinus]|uniref:carbon-nitrogen hydrolase family protein n=1 Tax=Spiribacter salinus TaxID=1335746 RepID=UPI001C9553D8|nr:carbon-nitrogen hydrolase family protein [Spiribacter salinus]MBY5269126.1 apolipoprotein acyltransferase [Spiribacter salinus]MDR9414528.1 carbon-nitrogen hydrolase family protein [Spiribacter sp.]
MTEVTRAAVVQMVSGAEVSGNLEQAGKGIDAAVRQAADLVVLPENFACMGRREGDILAVGEADGTGPIQAFLADTARAHGITLVGGSVPLKGPEPDRVRPACLVYGPDGTRLARYDKRHLFDVALADGEGYRESATFAPGDRPVTVTTPAGRLGLSICYDLRFPEHYRALVDQGAEILLAPSAFTATTGAAHWSVLVRARAIENLCFMVAPGQGGQHASGRATHGESLIVNAWGEVQARCPVGGGPDVAVADLNRGALPALRARFPALSHRLTPGGDSRDTPPG